MFGKDNFSYDDRLSELSELDDSFGQGDKISCSTPVKLKDRRSYSLIDVSNFDDDLLKRKKLTVSSDTIGSGSQNSLCKDSGYVHSESNTSLNSTKDHKKLNELIEDLKFKEVLITELQESNHSLRLKYAEAENRIAELRLKCESHCDCCNLKTVQSNLQINKQNDLRVSSNHRAAESCFSETRFQYVPTGKDTKIVPASQNNIHSSIPVTNDDSFLKVKRWQDSISSVSTVSSDTSMSGSVHNLPTATKLSSSVDRSPVVHTRLIGDRSVRVSPSSNLVHLTRRTVLESMPSPSTGKPSTRDRNKDVTLMIQNLQNLIVSQGELPVMEEHANLEPTSPQLNIDYDMITATGDNKLVEEGSNRLTVEGTAASVSFKSEYGGGHFGRVRYIDRKLEMERTIREGMNGIAEKGKKESGMKYRPWESNSHINTNAFNNKASYNSLYDCILQASECANRLSVGLSRIPTNLDQIRVLSNRT